MCPTTFAHVRHPWNASIDVSAPYPRRFYARLVGQAIRYGLPSARTGGAIRGSIARTPAASLAADGLARIARRNDRPDIDELMAQTAASWDDLAAGARRLPPRPSRLSSLALDRTSSTIIFVFGDSPEPLLVLKVTDPTSEAETREREALELLRSTDVAPRFLGTVGRAFAQEVVPGEPLRVAAVTLRRARELRWSQAHDELARGLEEIARVTGSEGRAADIDVAAAVSNLPGLSTDARKRIDDALGSAAEHAVTVLKHGDTSPQNCLFVGARLSGLVDWEGAQRGGAPGFDLWNAGLSYIEHGVGLTRWSQRAVLESFAAAWWGDFGKGLRAAVARVLTITASEHLSADLEVLFFARRVVRRSEQPGRHPTSVDTAHRMLELVCAR